METAAQNHGDGDVLPPTARTGLLGPRWWGAIAIVLVSVVVYLPAMRGEFVSDDEVYVTGDARLAGGPAGLSAIWFDVAGPEYRHQYYPLTSTVFWIQHQLWGLEPAGYHLVNVLLHALNAILVWLLLRRLGVPMAWVAGALFAVHPVHAQSVAWIAELKNTLSACLGLLAVLVFVRWLRLDEPGGRRVSSRAAYAGGAILYMGALAAKTAMCLVPAALAVVVWWKRGRLSRRDLMVIAPMAALGAAFVALTVVLEARYGGATGETFALSPLERGLVAARALWFYAGKLLVPLGLSFIYPLWTVDAGSLRQWAFVAAAAAVACLVIAERGRWGRGPAAATAYFALAIVPVYAVNVSYHGQSLVADHWQYFGSIGLFALAAAGAGALARRVPPHAVTGVAAGVLVVLAAMTWSRAHVYESAERLWADTIDRSPHAWAAHVNLGRLRYDHGDLEAAMRHFQTAVAIRPQSAGAHHNLGLALARGGHLGPAIGHMRQAVALRPDLAPAHAHLGIALAEHGMPDDALAALDEAVRLDPGSAMAQFNRARVLELLGDAGRAIAGYRRAVACAPGDARYHRALGEALISAGNTAEGLVSLQRARRLLTQVQTAQVE